MTEAIKPVRFGILIGLFGLIFGIGWAFFLVLGHEKIHEILKQSAAEKQGSFIQSFKPLDAHAHTKKEKPADTGHHHGAGEEPKPHFEGAHSDPIIELSHIRLQRSHVHAMGLGLATIIISFTLAFTSAHDRLKTIISILAGLGGLIYPFAWIVMGYRTPALGPDGAEASVRIIAGPGIALVLLGAFTAIVFLLKDILSKK